LVAGCLRTLEEDTILGTDHEAFKRRLRGVVAFPITPFDASGHIDTDAIGDNVEVPVEAGIGALVAAGGTGELFGLTPEEVAQVTEITVSAVAGRAAVIAGVGFGPKNR
jgi:dihydrodipicolinate synthase/N-acetylneuraminate lyase